ncbi:MAG TPA: ABC transporter substrate-binding protein [bacterium]|nr:ABC transporter substrate-binding protein [bacterium]HPR88854.1 ABC transporter substrate-binding protein [bacterium]
MKKWSALAFVLGLALWCQCGKKEPAITAGKTTVTFWHSFVSSTVPALNELIAKFEQENPDIQIRAQYIPTGDALIQKLITSVQSKTAPDISWVHSDYLEDLVEAGAIYKMAEFIDGPDGLSPAEMAQIYPALIQYASWRGTLYSLPMEATNLALLYNKDLFRKAGLDPAQPPRDWDELVACAKKLTTDTDGDGKQEQVGFFLPIFPATGPLGGWMVWQWLPFLWQAGGEIINPEQTAVLYDGPAGVAALTLWQNIYQELKLSTYTTDYDVAFASQRLAMALDGPWNLPRYKTLLQNFDWGFAPLPQGPKQKATIIGGEYLTIFKQSKNPAAAWKFIKWIIQPQNQAYWAMKSSYLPINRKVLEVPEFQAYLAANPNFKVFVDELEYSMASRPIDYNGLQITRHVAEALERATVGKIDPATALRESSAKSNALLAARTQTGSARP